MAKFSLREFLGTEAQVLIDGKHIEAARIEVVFDDALDEIAAVRRLVKVVVRDSESIVRFLVGVLDEVRSAPRKMVAEFHATSVPATLPEHSGSILRVITEVPQTVPEPVPVVIPIPVVGDGPANTPTIS